MKKIYLFLFLIIQISMNAQPGIQWQKCWGGSYDDFARSIQQTNDGGFIIVGYTDSNDGDVIGWHGSWDGWVVKLNSAGNIQWQKCLGGSGADFLFSVKLTSDNGYIISGTTYSNDGDVSGNHGIADSWIVKLDSTGILEWQKCLGGTSVEGANCIQVTNDGGYILSGFTDSNDGDVSGNHGGTDIWVFKIDSAGTIQWQKCLGGSDTETSLSIQQTIDYGYIVSGVTESNDGDVNGNHGNDDCWVIKIDSVGSIQWQKCYGGNNNEQINSILATSDSGYIFAGETLSNDGDVVGNHGDWDYWIVKLNLVGNIQWQKCLGGVDQDHAYSIDLFTNGGYLISGRTCSNDNDVTNKHTQGTNDCWIIHLDSLGSIEWETCLGGSFSDIGYSFQQTSDSGYIVSGWSQSNDGDVSGNHGWNDYWIIKLSHSTTGVIEIEKQISNISTFVENNQIAFNFLSSKAQFIQVNLYAIEGRLIYSQNEYANEGVNNKKISSMQLNPGLYFLTIN